MDSLTLSKDGFLIVELEKIKAGTFVLENIFFEKSKSDLKSSSIVELEKVLKLLEITPTIKIEISGHTDNDGDDDSNLELSIWVNGKISTLFPIIVFSPITTYGLIITFLPNLVSFDKNTVSGDFKVTPACIAWLRNFS